MLTVDFFSATDGVEWDVDEVAFFSAADGDLFYCDFEIDMCTMSQSATDDFDWEREHSEGEFDLPPGGYLLVDAKDQSQGDIAIIVAPQITELGVQCVAFK